MGLLDFIKNRNQSSPEPTAQPAQETAKQMYSREAAQDRTNPTPLALNENDKAATKEASDLFRKGTQTNEQSAPASTPTPVEGTTDPQQPMVQPSMSQEKAAPSLSPTSAQAGGKEHEQDAPTSPSPSPTPSPTPPRNAPSWDR